MTFEPYKHSIQLDSSFSFDELYRHPGDLSRFDINGKKKSICVIGGGISGLAAAYELCGHKVTLLESSNKCGGRILTHRFSDGTYAELGAMRIPANHHCTLHYVKKFNLTLRPFVNHNPSAYYYIRGIKTRIKNWQNLISQFSLQSTESDDPLRVYEDIMKRAMALLSSSDKWGMFTAKLSDRLLTYDERTLWLYLRHWLTQEATEYVGHATGMIQYEHASFLETLIDYFGLFRVDMYEIVGGMDQLPNAFVEHLDDCILYSTKVTGISLKDESVEITSVHNNQTKKEMFDYVICAIPAPCVARIDFDPPLPPNKTQAVRSVTYASAAKTLFHCKKRYWESDNQIFGGGSFTDLINQQCWYPSDNAKPVGNSKIAGFTGDDQKSYSLAPLEYKAADVDTSNKSGVFTAAYMWERNVRRFLSLSNEERTATIMKAVNKIHPQNENYVDEVVHHIWDEQENIGCGAFAYFAPGEHQRYQGSLCEPYSIENPRVFFSGEHLAVAHAWIQGAIQTGLEAAIAVLNSPSPK